MAEIRDVHAGGGGVCGAPRIHAILRVLGRRIGRHRVARLMRAARLRGLAAPPHRVRKTDGRHGHPPLGEAIPGSLADPTYVPAGEGWLRLAALIDLHAHKVVGRAIRGTLHAGIAVEALRTAIERQRPALGHIQHKDRGVRYAADAYRQVLAAAGMTPSMSRRGGRLDNAPMESFFHTLKVERVHHCVHATRDEARRDLFGYIEGFHDPLRLHSALGYRSPADIEVARFV